MTQLQQLSALLQQIFDLRSKLESLEEEALTLVELLQEQADPEIQDEVERLAGYL